jgi:transposase
MDEKMLYTALLGLAKPWAVERVDVKPTEGEVHVWVGLPDKTRWVCPKCLLAAPIHDHQERSWRHLDTCQYKTFVHARVPRLNCPNCGVHQLKVPWSEPGSHFTALFEALAIDWFKQASLKAVAKQLRLSWDEADGIQQRAVSRGLKRRQLEVPRYAGIDETSYQKRHEYVTVVSDLEKGRVLYVADDRGQEALDGFWGQLSEAKRAEIEAVAMDMWEPYIKSVLANLPGAKEKIVFDKFHVAQHLGKAVDKVRRQEYRELHAAGDDVLKGTRYLWLENPTGRSRVETLEFNQLREQVNRTSRAWALKETAMGLWDMSYVGAADRNFKAWYGWARRSCLEPMRKVAATIKRHWANIRTYFVHRITNAGSESMNSRIQAVKRRACGFRNRERFRNAIYFHCGGLDLYPAMVPAVQ